ncbi:hypothetical protein DY000_02031911 [Brassica cretica]|uniref:Uncharacterized protein n=1 Tax=Brassica cretica TaxID=69181 RepID=A0ABQ7DF63_BRACR|nr:hypothetical protein DY000_02031911 [Brassica cretica]
MQLIEIQNTKDHKLVEEFHKTICNLEADCTIFNTTCMWGKCSLHSKLPQKLKRFKDLEGNTALSTNKGITLSSLLSASCRYRLKLSKRARRCFMAEDLTKGFTVFSNHITSSSSTFKTNLSFSFTKTSSSFVRFLEMNPEKKSRSHLREDKGSGKISGDVSTITRNI